MKTIYLLVLNFKINFRDSDDGDCYAGDGQKVLGFSVEKESLLKICDEYNPIISAAENETVVYPVQKYNRAVKKQFGFILSNLGQDNYDYKLEIQEIEEIFW